MSYASDASSLSGSRDLLKRARRVTPGGVHSDSRSNERPLPLFIDRAEGAYLWDVDGNRYVDYILGQGGANFLGHCHPAVVEAVRRQLKRGVLLGGQSLLEVELAERLISLIPGVERVRFGVTGSEAVQAALRIARAATRRRLVLKFDGHYHGWLDSIYFNQTISEGLPGDGLVTPRPEAAGMLPARDMGTLVARWNDLDGVRQVLEARGNELAAVILEPVMVSGAEPPIPGFLEELRRLCSRLGVVLIFDEVVTGFRLGLQGAVGRYGVIPDLVVYGKAIGSGFPLSVVAGRAELFDWAETGHTIHKGTFNGNPISLASGLATLDVLGEAGDEIYHRVETLGHHLMIGIADVFDSRGCGHRIAGIPELFQVSLDTPNSLEDLRSGLTERGVRIAWNGVLYLSAAHTVDDVTWTLDRIAEATETLDTRENR